MGVYLNRKVNTRKRNRKCYKTYNGAGISSEKIGDKMNEEKIKEVLAKVKHPAIDCSLIDLGIVKDIKVEENKVSITVAFPSPNIPIGDQLVRSVQEPLEKFGLDVEVKTAVMNKEELQKFLKKEEENWRGM